ncbi:hypothetical protein BDD43_0032 [Mucilaginibacter gracilis]|uniref:Uncharacterized protein n=1 Tax=Mucilaginibacter gracilis TaxID=423350 RepID=A0A495IT41_9SPHI|nr:hypothetical protein [Mucilaginibacter gracilis]RKR79946.1 hypothetical protein BDD43_0032 [Mucilaginibacter gracilis]
MKFTGRRNFLKWSGLAASGLLLPHHADARFNFPENTVLRDQGVAHIPHDPEDLHSLAFNLLKRWGDGLLAHQVSDTNFTGLYGGILCPACASVHGRSADAILPLMYLGHRTKDPKYQHAAMGLYDWMEEKVSMPDGSWVSEIVISDWTGISVFTAVMLAETLTHFGGMLDKATKHKWEERLKKAAEFLYRDFTIHTGNINYPITCSYALALIGTYFNEPKYLARGKALAHEGLQYFTPNDHLLYGEGHPEKEPTAKGCYSVDLGYNVEESLQALVLYAKLTGDQEVFDTVLRSMKAHAEFMLPDGGWDNSWGTRNFKWTYWGSRTSDGCQPGYAIMAEYDPSFYQVALHNTQLLDRCTKKGLLHGGPHYTDHGELPCVHHTFCHSKALTTLLLKSSPAKQNTAQLPRLKADDVVKEFKDIQTWLIAKGGWRGTVTAYDEEYLMKSGHASGGALTMLWHQKVGPVITASMTTYQLVENFNMQRDKDPYSVCLTPRFQLTGDQHLYTNIHDLKATVKHQEVRGDILFETFSALVDESQAPYEKTAIGCKVSYRFTADQFKITAVCDADDALPVKYMLPVISASGEKLTRVSDRELRIEKAGAVLRLVANVPFDIEPSRNGRVFNFVPGLEAVPLSFRGKKIEVLITII